MWATAELGQAQFGDQRLSKRYVQIVEACAAKLGSSLPQACGSLKATKACYRFLSSEQVTPEKLLNEHQRQTAQRCQEQHQDILAVQDTADVDLSSHRALKELGYLQTSMQRGIMIHTSMAVTPQGDVLGLLDQQSWVRPVEQLGKRHQRRSKATAQKETQRWLDSQAQAFACLKTSTRVIAIADREADFYEFFASQRPANAEVLVRVRHDRRLSTKAGTEITHMLQALAESPEAGRISLEILRAMDRPARTAILAVRYTSVSIPAPTHRPIDPGLPKQIDVQLVIAEEVDPPIGVTPILWILLTTMAVNDLEAAVQCIEYYSKRWLIERFHYTLKSGCGVEDLQLESLSGLRNAIAMLSIVAWRIMRVLYHSRVQPQSSCQTMFESLEWQLLYAKEHPGKPLPEQPPSLAQAVLWLAKLGGFLARRSDGNPGIKTLWRGLNRLRDMTEAWKIFQTIPQTYG